MTHMLEDTTTLVHDERRARNPTLRKLVDGLLEHVRDLSDCVDQLSPTELEGAHQRFNLIAELMWATITDEKNRPAVAAAAGRSTDMLGSSG